MAANQDKEKKNAMVALIEKGKDGVNGTTNILARLWRIILAEENLTIHNWQRLLNKYQMRMHKLSSMKGSANLKGNLIRSLAEPKISWGSLIRGINILEYEEMEMRIRLKKRGVVKQFDLVVTNDDVDIIGEE